MGKFKSDENLPAEVTAILRESGHDAMTVLDQELGGHSDEALMTRCREEGRAMITLDLDFADIRSYPPADYSGIIVLRLDRQDKPHIVDVFEKLMSTLAEEQLVGKLWIVTEETVRIRG